jgi:hypothetical protein
MEDGFVRQVVHRLDQPATEQMFPYAVHEGPGKEWVVVR